MDKKYVSKLSDGIAHCPHCRGVILKDFKADPEAKKTSFLMRCPHCNKDVTVLIQDHNLQMREEEIDD